MIKATAAKQIQSFKKQFRGNIARTVLNENEFNKFKPGKAQKNGLIGVGILGKHAAIIANFAVSDLEQKHIAIALIHLSRSMSRKNSLEFVNLERKIIPIALKLKGKSNWDSTITTNAEPSTGEAKWKKNDSRISADSNLAFFQCPRCPHVEYSSCKAFQIYDLDLKQKCNACEVQSVVKLWKCECGEFWHNCPQHRYRTCQKNNPIMQRETKRQISKTASSQTNAKKIRLIGPASYEALLAEDAVTAKRKRDEDDECSIEPCIILGIPKIKSIKVSSLGPILKKRFICGK